MVMCAASGCFERSDRISSSSGSQSHPGNYISFHIFPKDEKSRKYWITAVGRKNWIPNANSVLCSKHFEVGCYAVFRENFRKLKKNALPTIFSTNIQQDNHHNSALDLPLQSDWRVETIEIKDEKDDSDCEFVSCEPSLVDVPDIIDPQSINSLMTEQPEPEELPPVVEDLVKKLSNDEEFEKECDNFYKANLEMDVEVVSVDLKKVISQPEQAPPPAKKINLSAGIDDIRTCRDLPGICDLCEESDDHLELLTKHFKENHQLKNGFFVCPFCDFTSIKHEVVSKHTTKVHKLSSVRLKCDQCDFASYRGDLYNRHMNQHLKEKIYSCQQCNYKTVSFFNFTKHMASKHPKGALYRCSHCDYTASFPAVIKRHETTRHSQSMQYKCDKCDFNTHNSLSLKKHKEKLCESRNQDDSNSFTHVCDQCDFKAKTMEILQDHILMKHPEKEILFCTICDYSSTEKDELTDHISTHLKNEPAD